MGLNFRGPCKVIGIIFEGYASLCGVILPGSLQSNRNKLRRLYVTLWGYISGAPRKVIGIIFEGYASLRTFASQKRPSVRGARTSFRYSLWGHFRGARRNSMEDLLVHEKECWAKSYQHIAGIDEVGRGCLFGDVVAAAVILPAGLVLEGVNDSKKLSEKKREELYDQILEQAVAVSVGYVDAATIDRINIKQAARLAMKKAVLGLAVEPEYLLVDAEKVDVDLPQLSIIKGDATSQSIAAASIIAKVTRDRLCKGEWEARYPEYGIAIHKGYATKLHREQIMALGPTPMHRRSFLKNLEVVQETLF
ncbi:ribonuclease HII [Paenibacillus azoreducens]|nr:ribonuclease HII [Paenibacillus azoreducens]